MPLLQNEAVVADKIKVRVLGRFIAEYKDKVLTNECSRSNKSWELFKYLILNRGRVLLPEVITDQLWPGNEYNDPKSVVRTSIFRLRNLIGNDVEFIKFAQGGYIVDQNSLWLDVDEFENLYRKGYLTAGKGHISEAIVFYKQAIEVYTGDLLPECAYSEWLIPMRSHYRSQYLNCVTETARFLNQIHSYNETAEIVSRALLIDYSVEELHILLLEALIGERKISQAKAHYEKATSMFYREMAVKPSAAMRNMLRQIQEKQNDGIEVKDFNSFWNEMNGRNQRSGALLCDSDIFSFLCQLETRRAKRMGYNVQIIVLSVKENGSNGKSFNQPQHFSVLKDVLHEGLRSCDIFCELESLHCMILLPTDNMQQSQSLLLRVGEVLKGKNLTLNSQVQYLQ